MAMGEFIRTKPTYQPFLFSIAAYFVLTKVFPNAPEVLREEFRNLLVPLLKNDAVSALIHGINTETKSHLKQLCDVMRLSSEKVLIEGVWDEFVSSILNRDRPVDDTVIDLTDESPQSDPEFEALCLLLLHASPTWKIAACIQDMSARATQIEIGTRLSIGSK
jgi:hypothetical protein